jgi:diguanylate cyclase (GGDEF)-like protein/PAS domain S-box-containing protein
MKLLARNKFQKKIGISFALLISLISINMVVAALASYSITNKIELQNEIEQVVRDIEQTRLTVNSFTSSLDRRLAQQVFHQIALTRQQIKEAAPRHTDGKLSSLISQLNDFKAQFQKYMIEADQMTALESRAVALGNDMLERLNVVRTNDDVIGNRQTFDAVIGRVLNILWLRHEPQAQYRNLVTVKIRNIREELDALKTQAQNVIDTNAQRLLFRIVRDTSDYVASYEKHLLYKDLNAKTEQTLFKISTQIQADCDQIIYEMNKTMQQYIAYALTITVLIFLLTFVTAPVLARYLTGEILKPIRSLVSITKKVAAGQLDVHANVEVEDEIGKLAHHFNLMTKSLKKSQKQLLEKHRALEEVHEELEKRVELRTKELALTNASLQSEIISRKQSEAAIQASEEKFRAMFELSPLGMARNTLDGNFLEANHALQDMLGYNLNSLRQRRISELYYEDPATKWTGVVSTLQKSGRYSLREVRIPSRDGQTLYTRLNGVLVTDSSGVDAVWSIFEDITEQKKSDELIWSQANFDALTGLPNRRMFQNSLNHEIKNSKRQSSLLVLMFLDLDKFKEVNDTLGHDKGDLLLIKAAKRIAGCIRDTDMVARLGGDEFTVILQNLDKISNAEKVAYKIINTLSQPFDLEGNAVSIGVSIGITIYPNDAGTLEELMNNADQAMYQAKADGRNCFRFYTQSLQVLSQTRARMSNDIRHALSADQFELYYQPIVELTSGVIYKAEALIRWNHPSLGIISPSKFISLAEETNKIVDIGNWVFHEAAKQAKRLRSNYYPQFQISINKSPIQFLAPKLCTDDWIAFLSKIGLSSNAVIIEITEELLIQASDSIKNQLMDFRNAGFQVSLDNFGTGYSSLTCLNQLNIDYLKIDKSLVSDLEPGSDKLNLCEAITIMAHKLGLKVIAEGVSTPLQHELLHASGCDYAQGFLYSKPLPMEEFEFTLIQDNITTPVDS